MALTVLGIVLVAWGNSLNVIFEVLAGVIAGIERWSLAQRLTAIGVLLILLVAIGMVLVG